MLYPLPIDAELMAKRMDTSTAKHGAQTPQVEVVRLDPTSELLAEDVFRFVGSGRLDAGLRVASLQQLRVLVHTELVATLFFLPAAPRPSPVKVPRVGVCGDHASKVVLVPREPGIPLLHEVLLGIERPGHTGEPLNDGRPSQVSQLAHDLCLLNPLRRTPDVPLNGKGAHDASIRSRCPVDLVLLHVSKLLLRATAVACLGIRVDETIASARARLHSKLRHPLEEALRLLELSRLCADVDYDGEDLLVWLLALAEQARVAMQSAGEVSAPLAGLQRCHELHTRGVTWRCAGGRLGGRLPRGASPHLGPWVDVGSAGIVARVGVGRARRYCQGLADMNERALHDKVNLRGVGSVVDVSSDLLDELDWGTLAQRPVVALHPGQNCVEPWDVPLWDQDVVWPEVHPWRNILLPDIS
mmetsp:Transcript_53138/g.154640  ORF Transcript_53138/g.154640 Transcript_53138/m.154640 type:complete len:414 (+) Transcript_53138:192-1433(+)